MVETTKKNGKVEIETFDTNATYRIESNLFSVNLQILIPSDNAWKKNPTVKEIHDLLTSSLTTENHVKPEDIQIVKAMFRKV